ncbi:DNA-directed RNA polymerase subunit alpha [Thermosipho affectus]|uniref:DNA-directed RNA polymerase subunit alpha n=1 Tax=Thermosipho affectus TaxID=660294 RepID=A0ABX3IHF2_9BACT|nr:MULTISPECIES: DNA-directed RNA polymerase subunit alpha [Thermosipho]ANQ53907.1 DNA-directed RNA polymerase subunit alpha [Thermosipho sp. 1070]ONN27258.1 DNA-directed RNA polymerase subunit alpha [Thermosipho affectus]OOC43597.1 DNA-directed RNA polymerase subunit alpha [Thermosipho sp. 1074]
MDFIMPKGLKMEDHSEADEHYYARFVLFPLEKGYATTIGNTLRRVLLSSIPSLVITDVKFVRPEKYHEFDTIEGIKEDIIEILLNLKKVQLKMESYIESPVELSIQHKGEGEIKAGDIIVPAGVTVANPNLHIATANEDADIEIKMYATIGKGFVPAAERNEKPDIGWIVLDGVYNPVLKVNWKVENVRVGKKTDYDKLILEIWTKKNIKPIEALKQSVKIINDHFKLIEESFGDMEDNAIVIETTNTEVIEEMVDEDDVLSRKIDELDLSMRALNCLKRDKIETIGDLLERGEDELLKIKNFGQKSLDEVKEKLKEKFGISFGREEE